MDPPPFTFKRTKSKPAQRKRETSPDDNPIKDVENGAEEIEESPSVLAVKLKSKVKKAKAKSKLSFGGDDEEVDGEVFQIKKSSLSRKLALGKHPGSLPLNLEQASITPSAGPKYDQAHLNELKANTLSTRPPIAADSTPTTADNDLSVQVMDVDMDESTTSATLIPAGSSIKAAKERRERIRKIGVSTGEDYISLSMTRREDFIDQGPHPESRLMREEDELGEGDDEFSEYTSAQERIALGKKARKRAVAQHREEMAELIADAEEDDEEALEWEQEQLRRGGHRTPEPSPAAVKKVYKPAPIPAATQLPSLTPALAKLSEQLTRLTASHANNTAALNTLAQEREQVDEREKEMREMVERAEEKRAWFGSFRDWIEGVADFLDEKYPLLEKLEDEHVSLLQERRDLIAQRRRTEDEDDLTIFLGEASTPPSSNPDEVDSFGRTIPKPSASNLRRERRVARLERRQIRLKRRKVEEAEEGYSTDSTLPPSDMEAYEEAMTSLAKRTKDMLADVRAEEFKDPTKGRWGAWREKYGDSYVNAWGGLGVISVWEFWARLEVVGWDCIEDHRSLDSFKWYKDLYEYSRPGSKDGEEGELGPDGDLVASMIATAIIPRICKIMESGGLDAYSERHIRRIVNLFEEVEASVEASNTKVQNLRKSAMTIFQNAVNDTEELLRSHHASIKGLAPFNPEAIPARRRFLARRMKLLKNLLRWRKFTGEQHGIGLLVTRLVDVCVLGVAENGWDVGGEEVVRNVASILPPDLITAQLRQLLI